MQLSAKSDILFNNLEVGKRPLPACFVNKAMECLKTDIEPCLLVSNLEMSSRGKSLFQFYWFKTKPTHRTREIQKHEI